MTDSSAWAQRAWRPLVLLLALGALYLACWMFIDAPTRRLLPLGVGAPEISAWLVVAALLGIVLSARGARRHALSRLTLVAAIVALAFSVTPFVRFPDASRRADAAVRAALGDNPLRDVPERTRASLRPRPLSVADLFRGVTLGDVRVNRDLPLAEVGGTSLTVDVYRPPQAGSFPIVVQIYGGAWQRGRPADNQNFARWIAARGYVVFAIDYRHAPAAHWPAQLDDVRLALAWIRDNAATYDADTARVALIGRSAGAHLAMLTAYTESPLHARAVISYYGPVDLVDSYVHPPHPDPLRIRTVEETFIGATPATALEAYRAASPITYATHPLPPTLLVYGARDHIVEPRYGAALRDKLVASGTTAVLIEIPWADHAFDEVFNGPSSQLALYHTERFLAWAMAGSPTRGR